MREEYEAWFIGKFGFPPMPIHSRVLDFCWEGYQAGVESMNKPVNLSEWQKLVAENELLTQQLDAATDQIAFAIAACKVKDEALRDCAFDESGYCINPDAEEALAATAEKEQGT